MQIDRLFEMTYLLIARGSVTAAELAERFEVSSRTIYRDVDVLSRAGIPVYAAKGRGGGIRLLPEFMMSRSLFSREEQDQMIAGLESLRATDAAQTGPILDKLAAIFGNAREPWLEVDFSPWGSGPQEKRLFAVLREAILARQVIAFDYYNSCGQVLSRQVEPLKLIFKGRGWYLWAFCRNKRDYRLFKLGRMRNAHSTGACFERPKPARQTMEPGTPIPMLQITLKFAPSRAYRVYDEFPAEQVDTQPDGSCLVRAVLPDDEWTMGYLLSFGEHVQVLEPEAQRRRMAELLNRMSSMYGN